MDWDEVRQPPAPGPAIGGDLAKLSIAEMEVMVPKLEAEIARIRTEIAKRKAHEAAADALFKR
ncbi:MAG: DUF1192 domain-containing protein [Hyphomicrobiaceae bacterium]|nr:DUF1192 domain-containing protein [Hyphomicrobiaceae bacterium]